MVGFPGESLPGHRGDIGDIGFQGAPGMPGLSGLKGVPGLMGPKGFKGEVGSQGRIVRGFKGEQGERGFDGLPGMDGHAGLQGEIGLPGPYGPRGPRGMIGVLGDVGWHGIDGVDGAKGIKGERGYTRPYELAPRGEPGIDGMPGLKGEYGDSGFPGLIGDQGVRGLRGFKGEIGAEGLEGEQGIKGEAGFQGAPGLRGLDGYTGAKGEQGDPAPIPPSAKSRGYIFARHSQKTSIPQCPPNSDKLWEGYSLASVIGSGRAVGQDLGLAGSCMLRFSTMPYMFCDINNVCSYAENNDDSLWLSTEEPMLPMMNPIPANDIQNYISRCVVCETRTRIIALHSQSMDYVDCPTDWEELWVGFSYLMVSKSFLKNLKKTNNFQANSYRINIQPNFG